MAKAGGASLEWLATGQGPMQPGAAAPATPDQPSALDPHRLEVAISTAETILQRTGKTMTADKKALFVTAIYDHLPAGEISQQDSDNIIRLFQSAA